MPQDQEEDIERSLPFILGRMESKLDSVLENQADHGQRIRKLEGYKHFLMGAIVIISGIATYVIDWLKGK